MRTWKEIHEKFNDLREYLKASKISFIDVKNMIRVIDEFEKWMFNGETKNDD